LTIYLYFAALSLQSGITIGGYGNGTGGNDLNGLQNPIGLCLDRNGSIYIADNNNNRVIKLQEGSLFGTIFAGTEGSGSNDTQLQGPTGLAIDTSSNIYIADSYNFRVMLWRQNSPTGILVAGTGIPGGAMNTFSTLGRLAVDSMGNLYVSDSYNHRVMKWAPNATSGTLVAGNGVAGNGSQQLNVPCGIYLDEYNSYLYIADSNNHRIQRYYLGGTLNATTVAGGNGPGTSNNLLNVPRGVYLSKKTGAMFIADFNNNRIQRWNPGATSGVTIAGKSYLSGASAKLLNGPSDLILSLNETYLYVSDSANNRVQRFQLI
jgi:sugar lactone lactonase YvrE